MSILVTLHLVISAALFVIIFIEGNDEPAFLRTFTAAFVALLWLPLLILIVAFVGVDWISRRLKGCR
jgi:hypothetical protein